jgi:hypothetical protein
MTTAQAEQPVETEATRIVDWRYAELVRAGYDADVAAALAQEAAVDLHLACDVLRNGCSAATAARIFL